MQTTRYQRTCCRNIVATKSLKRLTHFYSYPDPAGHRYVISLSPRWNLGCTGQIWAKKAEITEGKKANRASKWRPGPHLAQVLDPPLWRYGNCFLSPVATDGTDGNGLKFEKITQFFQISMSRVSKILRNLFWLALADKIHLISSL